MQLPDWSQPIHIDPDAETREKLWPYGKHHPAKMPPSLLGEIARRHLPTDGSGLHIVDPFGGIGTTGLLAHMGYHVTLIEITEDFANCAAANAHHASHVAPTAELFGGFGYIDARHADAADLLARYENAFSYCVTSPPFFGDVGRPGRSASVETYLDRMNVTADVSRQGAGYDAGDFDPRNVGSQTSQYGYRAALCRVWMLLTQAMRPDGLAILVVGDAVRDGKILPVHEWIASDMTGYGFTAVDRWKRHKRLGFFRQMRAARAANEGRDEPVIDYEVVLVMRLDSRPRPVDPSDADAGLRALGVGL